MTFEHSDKMSTVTVTVHALLEIDDDVGDKVDPQ